MESLRAKNENKHYKKVELSPNDSSLKPTFSKVSHFEHMTEVTDSNSAHEIGKIVDYTSPISKSLDSKNTEKIAMIWGTTINIEDIERRLTRFFRMFNEDLDAINPTYINYVKHCLNRQTFQLSLNCMHLYSFDPYLYSQLISYPLEIIPIADLILQNIAACITGKKLNESPFIHVRPYNTEFVHSIRDLEPRDISHLITIRGMISRVSQIFPDMKVACFKCIACGKDQQYVISHEKIVEPSSCPNCKKTFRMKLQHNQSRYANKQLIKIQETPGSIPEGEIPQTISLYAFDTLVDSVRAGDKLEVVGIYRAVAKRLRPKARNLMSVYKSYIDVVYFRRVETPVSCWNKCTTLADILTHRKILL